MKKISIILFRISMLWFAVSGFNSCKDLPEERKGPFYNASWDTIVQVRNLILPGDTLVVFHSLASNTDRNKVFIQSKRVPLDVFDYQGPDSDFVFTKSLDLEGKFLNRYPQKVAIPSNIRPGLYKFKAWSLDGMSETSDSVDFQFFITVSTYPFSVVDTPTVASNGIYRIDSSIFKFQIRSFGSNLKEMELQWYDSLKLQSLGDAEVIPIPIGVEAFTEKRFQSFPVINRKRFYLKAKTTTIQGRSVWYWIPFLRTR